MLRNLWQEDEGQDLTACGLFLALIALVAIATMAALGNAINLVFPSAANSLSTATWRQAYQLKCQACNAVSP